jgi:lipopolysaccharide export system permease protein
MLQTFLPLFIMTLGICWFIVLMQFLWKYIDDMVGKGLSITVLGEMFFYAALSLIPMALPLAILFSSLMTFGNLGERFELLAMKSAGISLVRIMRPLIVLAGFISVGAFYFQDAVMPISQVKMWSLISSMRMKSPELDIPVGVFYNEIQGYNLYVKEKNSTTGLLKNLMIYNYSSGFNNATIIVADSGRLKMSEDKLFLVFTLYNGEAFQQNIKKQSASVQIKDAVPYRRESFGMKEILIEFDANFNRVDESFFQSQYIGKSLGSLDKFVDSVSVQLDSIRQLNSVAVYNSSYKRLLTGNMASGAESLAAEKISISMDSLFQSFDSQTKSNLLARTKASFENTKADYYFKGAVIGDESVKMRRHMMEWHTRFAISFACIMFFFVGAPLGAIIRKGGLGMPVVLSTIIFISYYCVNNIGSKMARDAVWPVWQGMWLSSIVFTALGIFITYKAVKDSALLNADTYLNTIKNILGTREMRKLQWKEVIMFTPRYYLLYVRLTNLADEAQEYIRSNRRWQNYMSYWEKAGRDAQAQHISDELEEIVEELSNSDHILILNKLIDFPIIKGYNLLPEASIKPRVSLAIGLFLPIGIPVYLITVYRRKLLFNDIRTIHKVSEELKDLIANITGA